VTPGPGWQVLYCSNPSAPGGPVLRSPPGQLLAAGQELIQTLSADGAFRNQARPRAGVPRARGLPKAGALALTARAPRR
jgi:hypothetical protein